MPGKDFFYVKATESDVTINGSIENLPAILRSLSILELIAQVKAKIEKVNDYEASSEMKTNVVFIKVPVAKVKIYFKKPNKQNKK